MFHSVSIQEAIWTLFSLVALGFTLRGLAYCISDLAALKQLPDFVPNGPRHILAKGLLLGELSRVIVSIAFVLVGVIAANLPANPDPDTSASQTALAIILIAANIFNTIASANAVHTRVRLDHTLEESNEPDVQEGT